MAPPFSVRSQEDSRDRAVSEIMGTLFIIALLTVSVSLAVLLFTDIDLPEKAPYICVDAEMEETNGLEVITVSNNAGDSAWYWPSGSGQYQVLFRLESSGSWHNVSSSGGSLKWSPGTVLYIYNSDSGYHVTDDISGISGAEPLPDGDISLVVSDPVQDVLIYSMVFEGAGNSAHHEAGFSAEAWVKWNRDPAPLSQNERWATIAVYGNSDNNRQWHLEHNMDNSRFEFLVATPSTGSGGRWVESLTEPEKDIWYHLVGVYNQNLTSDNLFIYVNGQDATRNHFTVTGDLRDSPGPFQIGGPSGINYPIPGSRRFDGEIRGFNTYDRALTSAEIAERYAAGRP